MKPQCKKLAGLTILLGLVSLGTSPASAQQSSGSGMSATLSSREAYVGVPVTLRIEIPDATSHEPPSLPDIDGLRIESHGVPSRSSQTTIINGRRTDRSSVTYAWRVTPRRAGRFEIPAIDVSVNGRQERTRALTLVVTRSETGDLLFAEVTGAEKSIYVGQALPVTLKIWVKPFQDVERGIVLSEADMWQFVSDDPTSLGVFGEKLVEMSQNRQRPNGREVLRTDANGNDRSYYLYEIETSFYPKRPGQIEMDDVQVVVSYPTGVERSRDLFSMFERRLAVHGTRPIVADASVASIEVQPVPSTGRPADYRGAVGRYQIAAQASPTQVKAGDPITLHIGIYGDGPLDLVQAPPLAESPQFTRDFRAPNEPLAGIVENNIKVFSVSIRPRQAGLAEIPAIPFTFFDPDSEEFVTVRSEPIAIQVDAADTLSLASIVGQERPIDRTAEAVAPTLSFQNHSAPSLLNSHAPWPMWPIVIVLVTGPLAFAGTWFVRRFWLAETGWVGPRLTPPLAAARHAVTAARTPQEISTALLSFLASRLNVQSESLTRSEALAALRQQGTIGGLDELNDVLVQCERATYAPVATSDVSRLREQALNCLSLTRRRASSRRRKVIHPPTLVTS